MKKRILTLACLFSMLPATAAIAQEKPADDAKKAEETADSGKLICKVESSIGSRLQKEKRCMTAAQWRDVKRDDRMSVERSQAGRYKNN